MPSDRRDGSRAGARVAAVTPRLLDGIWHCVGHRLARVREPSRRPRLGRRAGRRRWLRGRTPAATARSLSALRARSGLRLLAGGADGDAEGAQAVLDAPDQELHRAAEDALLPAARLAERIDDHEVAIHQVGDEPHLRRRQLDELQAIDVVGAVGLDAAHDDRDAAHRDVGTHLVDHQRADRLAFAPRRQLAVEGAHARAAARHVLDDDRHLDAAGDQQAAPLDVEALRPCATRAAPRRHRAPRPR